MLWLEEVFIARSFCPSQGNICIIITTKFKIKIQTVLDSLNYTLLYRHTPPQIIKLAVSLVRCLDESRERISLKSCLTLRNFASNSFKILMGSKSSRVLMMTCVGGDNPYAKSSPGRRKVKWILLH